MPSLYRDPMIYLRLMGVGRKVVDPVTLSNSDVPYPYSKLNADELGFRNSVVSEFDLGWNPDIDNVSWDDTVAITSESQLYNWLNGTAVSGVTRNVARNQRVQLTKPFTNDRTAAIDRLRGNDWLALGKALLIESANPADRVDLRVGITISGATGVYFRRIGVKRIVAEDSVPNTEWVAGCNSVTVTAVGAGFQVGQTLTLATSNSNMYNLPVLTVASVDGNGGITGLTITNSGIATATVTGIVASSATSTTNAVITSTVPINPRDTSLISVSRNGTFPLLPVVIFDDCDFSLVGLSNQPYNWYSIAKGQNVGQVYMLNCKFNGYQTAIGFETIRRLKVEGCDFQNGIGDAIFMTNWRGDSVVAGVGSFNTVYPDKTAYLWNRLNTIRNLYDNAGATTPSGKVMGIGFEHTDGAQTGTGTDTGPIIRLDELMTVYAERETYIDSLRRTVRLAGQTQGIYNDDTPNSITGLTHNCIIASSATASYVAWSGDYRLAYCTGLRTGKIPPSATVPVDGFAGDFDARTGFYSRAKNTWAGTKDHYIRRSLMGVITTSTGTGIQEGNIIDDGTNSIVDPKGGATAYADAFPSIGATNDSQGRMQYAFTDDGLETQEAFRSRMYAAFGKAYAGCTDPALWS